MFSTIRTKIDEHRQKIEMLMYADGKAKENKLFEVGMKQIEKASKGKQQYTARSS